MVGAAADRTRRWLAGAASVLGLVVAGCGGGGGKDRSFVLPPGTAVDGTASARVLLVVEASNECESHGNCLFSSPAPGATPSPTPAPSICDIGVGNTRGLALYRLGTGGLLLDSPGAARHTGRPGADHRHRRQPTARTDAPEQARHRLRGDARAHPGVPPRRHGGEAVRAASARPGAKSRSTPRRTTSIPSTSRSMPPSATVSSMSHRQAAAASTPMPSRPTVRFRRCRRAA